MDRSYLSKPTVVAASRAFVCIRLTTYENAAEASFLKSICPTGSGELENTVFAILSPDGKRQLSRASRSPREVFDGAADMAQTMKRIASWYRAGSSGATTSELPTVESVRLAVNVAACDRQPLVVAFGTTATARAQILNKLKSVAWTDEFRGRFVYAVASQTKELENIAGVPSGDGILIVQPDRFGLKGTVLERTGADGSTINVANCLKNGLATYSQQDETLQEHVHDGRVEGVFWQTAIPVTDPMERRARQQTQAESGR
jgi:hypothetical protein